LIDIYIFIIKCLQDLTEIHTYTVTVISTRNLSYKQEQLRYTIFTIIVKHDQLYFTIKLKCPQA